MPISYTGGISFSGPSAGDTNWHSVVDLIYTKISAHDHTGSGMGLQIATGALASDSVTAPKILLANNAALRARNAAASADVNLLKLSTGDITQLTNTMAFASTVQAITAAAGAFTVSSNLVTLSNAGAATATINVPTAAQAGQPVLVTNIGVGDYVVTITGRPAASDVATLVASGSMMLLPISTTTWAVIPGGGCTLA